MNDIKDLIYVVTKGLDDRYVDYAFSLEEAFKIIARRFCPDEILLQIVEVKTMIGENDVDKLSSMDVYYSMMADGYYSE